MASQSQSQSSLAGNGSIVPLDLGGQSGAALQRSNSSSTDLVPVVPAGSAPCWYGCGLIDTVVGGKLRNTGSNGYPRYCCGPCSRAARAIDNSMRGDSARKDFLSEMKRKDPERYKLKVRSAAIMEEGTDPTQWHGVMNMDQRASMILSFSREITQTFSMKEKVGVHWLNKRQFHCRMRWKEGMDSDEARAEWDKAMANPLIQKEGTGDDIVIPTSAIKKTEACREKTSIFRISSTKNISSAEELAEAQKRMRFSAMPNSITDPSFEDAGAAVFRNGGRPLNNQTE